MGNEKINKERELVCSELSEKKIEVDKKNESLNVLVEMKEKEIEQIIKERDLRMSESIEIEKQNELMEILVMKNSEKEQVYKDRIETFEAKVKEKEEFHRGKDLQ